VFKPSLISDLEALPDQMIEREELVPWPTPASFWPTYHHRLYLLAGTVYSLLLNEGQKPLGVTCYRNRSRLSQDVFLRFLFEQEPSLTQPYLSRDVVLGEGPFFLLPTQLCQSENLLPLARTLLDDALLPNELQLSVCPQTEAYAVFTLSPRLKHVLDRSLGDYELQHLSSHLIRSTHRLADQIGQALTLTLLGQQVLITALRDGQLQLCNSYAYQEPLEAVYFLQTVRHVTGLTQKDFTCYAMGETNPSNLDPASIWHHLPGLQVPPLPGLLDISVPVNCPHWQFLFLA
jgi:hypothetical protein